MNTNVSDVIGTSEVSIEYSGTFAAVAVTVTRCSGEDASPPPVVPQAASGVRRAMMVAAVIILFAMRIGYAGKPYRDCSGPPVPPFMS